MKNYSIIRIGNEYVVQAGDNSVLGIASRRRAARLVTDAAELLDSQPPPTPPEPTIASDAGVIPDPGVVPDLQVIPDPKVKLDPSKVS